MYTIATLKFKINMFSTAVKAQSVRYTVDGQPQTAWSGVSLQAALIELMQANRAVIAVALAYQVAHEVTESFTVKGTGLLVEENLSTARLFQQSLDRNLGEDWSGFVKRTWAAAPLVAEQLQLEIQQTDEVKAPEEGELLFRISWCSETEWQETFGMNLLKLHEGDRTHPGSGKDIRDITYLFQYPDEHTWRGRTAQGADYVVEQHRTPSKIAGRKMFDLAEKFIAQYEEVVPQIKQFLIAERKKILPEETIHPAIVYVSLRLSLDGEQVSMTVAFNDENPENDPLYQYWKVALKDFKPVLLER